MSGQCNQPELSMELLAELRANAPLTPELALHLEECGSCRVAAERQRRMVAVWGADRADDRELALAVARFHARFREAPSFRWLDAVPFATAGVVAGGVFLAVTTLRSPAPRAHVAEYVAPATVGVAEGPGIAPVFAATPEAAEVVRARPHIETVHGVAPLVDGLRLEVGRGESVHVALAGGHSSKVEGPCLVEFWSSPTEVGGWRFARVEAPAKVSAAPTSTSNAPPAEGTSGAESVAEAMRPSAPPASSGASPPIDPNIDPHKAPSAAPAEGTKGQATPPANGKTGSKETESNRAAEAATNKAAAKDRGATTKEQEPSSAAEPGAADAPAPLDPRTAIGRVKLWAQATSALQQDDFDGADKAFAALSRAPDGVTRDGARLARAELWLNHGREKQVRPVLEQLAENGATLSIRRKAAELLVR